MGTRTAQQRSEALKERIYITFTALAVTIAYERDAHPTTGGAALTLLATVLGTLLAMFVASVVAHLVMDNALPSRNQLAHLIYVSLGSSGVVLAPIAILGISAAGWIDVATALRAIATALALTLVAVTLLAVRTTRLEPRLKALSVAIIAALGLAALAMELAVH